MPGQAPFHTDEHDLLLGHLAQQRFVLRLTAHGLTGVVAFSDAVAAEAEVVVRGIADLGQRVPVPQGVPWFPADLDAWSVRWVLMYLVSETARHAGHADIVREAVDGATAFPLLAAAEGWPATPWLQPWEPSR